ncbi:MAG: hypothetical protein U0414_11005 [Polyangiaceae bacterium]
MSGPTPRRAIAAVATGAAWLVGLSALLTLADGFLGTVHVARAVLGGLLVSLAVGRAGVLWDDDDPDADSYKKPALLALKGAVRGASVALATIAIASAVGWATIGAGTPALAIFVGLLVAAGNAVRDELLLRALPIHFARRAGLVGDGGRGRLSISTPTELGVVGFCALVSLAPLVLAPRATAGSLVFAASIGALHAAMQIRSRSAWGPIASSFALRLILGPTLQAGLLRIDWSVGELAVGSTDAGPAVWVFAALAIAVAAVGIPRRPLPPPDPLSAGAAARPRATRRSPRTRRPRPEASPASPQASEPEPPPP